MDIEAFRQAGYQAIDRICSYYQSLEDKPVVSAVAPGYLRQALPDSAPEHGEKFQTIADDYQRLIMPGLTHWQHPSFFAYFPTACTFEGILGDLYANSACNPGFNWSCSPACTELEAVVSDWAAKLLGLDSCFLNASEVGGGVIQSTASEAALIAVVAARSSFQRSHTDARLEDMVLYVTTQTHSLGAKAAKILGLKLRALEVARLDNFALRGETLLAALEEDLQRGLHPFMLVATLGTTACGAIDNLSEIFSIASRYPSLWVHVDAAWAGVTLACPEYRERGYLREINQHAHSFCTNFHKWGLTNFDASLMWVRDRTALINALDVTPEFLRTKQGDAGTVIDYRNWHLGLGRRFRSLKLWFVLRSYGAEGFRAYIREGIRLNEYFSGLIQSSPNFELVTPPSFALSVFRVRTQAGEGNMSASQDFLTRRLFDRISARQDIQLTQAVLDGMFCIRFAIGAARTEEKHVLAAFNLLTDEVILLLTDLRLHGQAALYSL